MEHTIIRKSLLHIGYLLDSTIHTVTLSEGGDNLSNSESIKNSEPTGTLSVTKEDDITGNTIRIDNTYHHGDASIAGAVYTLYANGRITNRAGTVTYFNANEQIANFTFDEKGIATVRVLKSSNSKLRANGSTLTGIPLGNYYLKETTVPVGYKQDTNTYSYTFSYVNQNTPVIYRYGTVLNDIKREPFEIIKISSDTNDTAELIEGAEFTVILKKYVEYYGSFEEALKHTEEYAYDEWCVMKTDVKGYAMSNRLAWGTYVVRETYVPSDTIIGVKDFEVTLTKDSETPTQSWKVENDLPFSAYFKLVKRDKLSGKTVIFSNATFELYKLNEITNEWEQVKCKVNKDYYTTWTTDEKGIAYTENKLHYGTYKLTEIKIPNGFNELDYDVIFRVSASNETCEYDIDGDAWITVDVTNLQPTGTLKINKKVEEIDPNSGYTYLAEDIDYSKIKFKLTAAEDIIDYSDGSHYYDKDEVVGVYSVSENGTLTVENLPMGKYHVEEIETLDGYILDKEIHTVEFTQKDTTTKVYEYILNLENLMTTVKISKTDIGGAEVEGAELRVIDKNGNIVDSWISTNEKHIIKGLLEGETYTLIEDYAPDGYVISQSMEFTVGDEKQDVKMIDKVVEISKVDVNGNMLEGATLIVTNKKTKNIVDKWVSTKEPHKVCGLIEGETYTLHEEIAINGYVKATDITFQVSTDKNTQKIEMIDKQVEVSKINVYGEKITGVVLKVIDKNNKTVDSWTSTGMPHKVSNLVEGETYILREETAVEGYVKAKDVIFTVTTDKKTQRINMIDKIVSMSKVDIGGNEIEGAEMSVTDERGNIVDSWISTKEPHHISNLVEGRKYVLHELYAPEGFTVATDVEFVVTMDKKTQEIVLIDKIVEMSKKDVNGNELEGATMIVTHTKTKNIVDKWVSGKEPHKIQGLIEGESYILHEEIVVDGYVKATDINFQVSTDKDTQRIEMIDKVVLISKTDLTTGEELPGAELIVTDKDGNVIDKWISSDEPHHVSGLEEGKEYTLTEITCPYGYEQAESITFTVSYDKQTQLIQMQDMPILKTIKLVKTDSETKEIIKADFKFGIYEDLECTRLIKEVTSDKENGTATFEDLRYGEYYIKELEAPNGYQLSDKIVKIEINDKGTFADEELLEDNESICEFTYYNKPIPKIQTGNETNYLFLIISIIISLLGITTGIIILKKSKQKNY